MKKTIFNTLFLLASLMFFPISSFAEGQSSISLESRSTYTRWYEYPGTYYEEEFSFTGIRADYFLDSNDSEFIKYAFTGSLYPVGSYTSWPSASEGAFAARVGYMGQARIPAGDSMKLILQAEVSYLLALGNGGSASHSEDFAVYLPSVSAGAGLLFDSVAILGASSLSVMYTFGLVELGVDTDNYVSGSPVTENWSDSAISAVLNYGF